MIVGFKYDALGPYIEKDPSADLDYTLNWSGAPDSWLGSDTIASVVWTASAGITLHTQTNSTTTVTTWMSGGVAGTTYTVSGKITTASGRVDTRTFRVVCKAR